MRGFLRIALVTLLLPCGCLFGGGDDPRVEGPGSETVGIRGDVVDAAGKPARSGTAWARPAAWYRDTAEKAAGRIPGRDTLIGKDGTYRIAPLAADSYFVEIRGDSGYAALVPVSVKAGALTQAPTAVLKPVGGLKGTVLRGRPSQASVFVRLAGIDRLLYLAPDSTGFRFADLPAGRYTVQVLSGDPALGQAVYRDIVVESGAVTDAGALKLDAFGAEEYALWPNSRALEIHAGPQGADLSADVADFPLLVRLGKDFPFDSAASDGSDLRFAGRGGRHLAYALQRWDAQAREALVWVRADTVRAGDDTQSVTLLWGRAGAPPMASEGSVFSEAQGWLGAWHLDAASQGLWPDGSSRADALGQVAAGGPTPEASPFGACARFAGSPGPLSSSTKFRAPAAFTLSLWFKADGAGKLIGFEDSYLAKNTTAYDRHLWIEADGTVHFGVYIADPPEGRSSFERVAVSPPGFADGAWHHVAATMDPAAGMALYLDGARAAANADAPHAEDIRGFWVLGGGTLNAWSPSIGARTLFNGCLDEAGAQSAVRSDAWIKLAHASQAPGSTVVRLR